jgi:adenine phosphoribosyltransferase
MTEWPPTWTAQLGDVSVTLPLITMPSGQRIYTFDLMGRTDWNQVAARLLADRIRQSGIDFDIFLTAEAKAIALNQSLAECLGQDDYIVARKSLKVYMTDPIELNVTSVTTAAPQKFFLGRDRYEMLRGRQVCVVDDVVSTGGTMGAFCDLAQRVGFDIVLIACVLTEGQERTEFEGIPLISLDHIPFPGGS